MQAHIRHTVPITAMQSNDYNNSTNEIRRGVIKVMNDDADDDDKNDSTYSLHGILYCVCRQCTILYYVGGKLFP